MPKWALWLHNLMMQDDASVPDNQDATSGTFKHALGDAALAVAFDFVEERICQKIERQGIKLGRRSRKKVRLQLEKMLRDETLSSIKVPDWKWWGHQDVTIEFSDQDQQDLTALTSRLIEVAPTVITDLLPSMGAVVLKDLKRGWLKYRKARDKDIAGFRKHLTSSWGAGFSLLEMLITIATEASSDWKGVPQCAALTDAHHRLHARACQIANEVVTLLHHGYADGAMARWRTLHEIVIVMAFLGTHGDDAAKQYIDHQIVESWRATREYQSNCAALNQESLSPEEVARTEREYQERIAFYGSNFGTQYGWAAAFLKKPKPSFYDIARSVGLEHLRPFYRMASHGVHANPKGVFNQIGVLSDEVLLAGPSNFGMADPGHNSAISLYQATVFLLTQRPTFEALLTLKIMERLTGEIGEALIEAHASLEEAAE